MKLRTADIDKILAENMGRASEIVSADDYVAENAAARDSLIQSLTAQKNPSSARYGEVLPLARRPMSGKGQSYFPQREVIVPEDSRSALSVPADFENVADRDMLPEATFVARIQRPSALLGVDLDLVNSRAELIRQLVPGIPLNEMGLPRILYRADMLDWNIFRGNPDDDESSDLRYQAMADYLEMATIHLSYVEGFPALPTGEPLWAKLPFETSEHYSAFTDYCTLPGTRELQRLRQPLDQVICWFHEDYWSIRVKCYDMLQQIHAAKVREQRILSSEDKHYVVAERLLAKLEAIEAEVDWNYLKDDPEKFVKVMDQVTKIQRAALGLNVPQQRGELKSETLEVTMRKMVGPEQIEASKTGDESAKVRSILRTPEALASAQELIIRMTQSVQEAAAPPSEE